MGTYPPDATIPFQSIDRDSAERWLTGWSLARGLPLPRRDGGELVGEVGWPEQLRCHVFVDAGPELRDCSDRVRAPYIYVKASSILNECDWPFPRRGVLEARATSCTVPRRSEAKSRRRPGKLRRPA